MKFWINIQKRPHLEKNIALAAQHAGVVVVYKDRPATLDEVKDGGKYAGYYSPPNNSGSLFVEDDFSDLGEFWRYFKKLDGYSDQQRIDDNHSDDYGLVGS